VTDPEQVATNPTQGRYAIFSQAIGNSELLIFKTIVPEQTPVGSEPNDARGILKDADYLVILPASKEFMRSLVGPLAHHYYGQI